VYSTQPHLRPPSASYPVGAGGTFPSVKAAMMCCGSERCQN